MLPSALFNARFRAGACNDSSRRSAAIFKTSSWGQAGTRSHTNSALGHAMARSGRSQVRPGALKTVVYKTSLGESPPVVANAVSFCGAAPKPRRGGGGTITLQLTLPTMSERVIQGLWSGADVCPADGNVSVKSAAVHRPSFPQPKRSAPSSVALVVVVGMWITRGTQRHAFGRCSRGLAPRPVFLAVVVISRHLLFLLIMLQPFRASLILLVQGVIHYAVSPQIMQQYR